MVDDDSQPPPSGAQTTHLDSMIDELEELPARSGHSTASSVPPPLPKRPLTPEPLKPASPGNEPEEKKGSPKMIVVGVIVVVLATVLGIGAGAILLGGFQESSAAPRPTETPLPPEASDDLDESVQEPITGDEREDNEANIVQIEEVVVGAD